MKSKSIEDIIKLTGDMKIEGINFVGGSEFKIFETKNFYRLVFESKTKTVEGNISNKRVFKVLKGEEKMSENVKMPVNSPRMITEQHEGMVKRYVHQPLTVDHFGIQASIKENGKVVITAVDKNSSNSDEVEYDQIEVPASLIFKLASLLKATRTISFVPVSGTIQSGVKE